MTTGLQFFSASSTEAEPGKAVASLVDQIESQAGESLEGIDLALVFLSSHFDHEAPLVFESLQTRLHSGVFLGCTAEGVIERERELEEQPAISLAAAQLPGVTLAPFMIHPDDWTHLLLDPEAFRSQLQAPQDVRLFILLGDPFSSPVEDVLEAFNTTYPGVPVVGGMASGALRQFGNTLAFNNQVTNMGAVGVALAGPFDVDVIVSQGCRPIWQPFQVTSAQKNVIYSLDGQPPLALIQDLIADLPEEDRVLMQSGLFVGRAIRTGQEERLGRGDFLIRGVMGIDREDGSIAIGDSVIEGERIQFHLRDALTAQEDLEMNLIPQTFRDKPIGALLFSCNGRGTRLYDHPDGDISVVQQNLGGTPLAGFFCAGEIGPIGQENFLHGNTASLAVFRPLNEP